MESYTALFVDSRMSLTSLTWVPTRLTQSVIPIGATLFVIAEAISFPDIWKQTGTEKGIAAHDNVELPLDLNGDVEPVSEVSNK